MSPIVDTLTFILQSLIELTCRYSSNRCAIARPDSLRVEISVGIVKGCVIGKNVICARDYGSVWMCGETFLTRRKEFPVRVEGAAAHGAATSVFLAAPHTRIASHRKAGPGRVLRQNRRLFC